MAHHVNEFEMAYKGEYSPETLQAQVRGQHLVSTTYQKKCRKQKQTCKTDDMIRRLALSNNLSEILRYAISDQNILYSLPYFKPNLKSMLKMCSYSQSQTLSINLAAIFIFFI